LALVRQKGEHGVAKGGGVGAEAPPESPILAVPRGPDLGTFDVDDIAIQHAQRGGTGEFRHQGGQQRTCELGKVGLRKGGVAEVKALQGQAEPRAARHCGKVAR
jgi:hypothetical protein